MAPLTVKNEMFENVQKSSTSYVTRFSQPKYYIPRSKTETGSLKQKNYQCYIRRKKKYSNKKCKNENFGKKQKNISLSCPKDYSTHKLGA